MNLERSINNIAERLDILETPESDYETETDEEIEAKFAKLREARAKVTDAFGNKACEDIWDSITQDESDYYLKMNLSMSPEERYQHKKEAWYFHKSSWCMRHDNGYDGHGCNNGECIQECRYYPKFGRIEDEEVIQRHKEIEERYRKRNALI